MASGSSNFASATAPCFIDHQLGALFTLETQLVGIDEPREKITNLLIGDDMQRRVITVFGMGGLGKTTITRRVYEGPQMAAEDFVCRAWITVSQSFNRNVLLRDIIRQVSPPDENKRKEDGNNMQSKQVSPPDENKRKEDGKNMQSIEDLMKQLGDLLQNKRYIIVLDDIWSIDAWESLKHALPENHNRSRVLITTRIEDVAKNCCADACGADYIYKMQLLSKEESMELFQKRVFGHDKDCPMHLKEVANEVINKCGGLPLAIVAMAGVLKSMDDDHHQWSNLLNNLSSILETNLSLEGMKKVLLLSYNHLPYLLKPCFLYLSIFPEDHLIKRKNLIQLWIAEGLVTNQYAMSAEDVAECYFNELVSRSLIMPSVVGWNGKVKSGRIHDIMLEVLVFKSMDENMVSIYGKQSRTPSDGNVIRRLSLQGERKQIRCIPDDVNLSRVTSLSIYDFPKIPTFLPRLRLLRVLVLEYYSFDLEERRVFCRILSKLGNLRYLNLKETRLDHPLKHVEFTFSKSISKLQNLVTLDIRNIGIYPHISSVAKLRQLRHFLMDNRSWSFLSMPPKLIMLRNFKDLQTLVGLCIDNIQITKELGFLTQLRMLELYMYSSDLEIISSLYVSLDKLSGSLLSLRIIFEKELVENHNFDINNPPSLLQSLFLHGNFKIPNWVSSLSNLAKLTLITDVKDMVNNFGVIKTLPNLLYLTLSGHYYDFNRSKDTLIVFLIPTGGFQRLKFLKIVDMHKTHAIEFQKGCMPVLEKFVLHGRPSYVIGIQFFPCLQEIVLDTRSMDILEQLKSDAETHQNNPRITIINR